MNQELQNHYLKVANEYQSKLAIKEAEIRRKQFEAEARLKILVAKTKVIVDTIARPPIYMALNPNLGKVEK